MNQKSFILLVLILIIFFSVWAAYFRDKNNVSIGEMPRLQPEKISETEPVSLPVAEKNTEEKTKMLFLPLNRAGERITKKPFGIFITPQTSPVQPEKFRGYHTGTDFEILPGEENAEVSVKAVCSGKLVMKKSATGYGGVAVESCELNGEPITVVYGHLKLASININVEEKINAGDMLGILGRGYSNETNGERKHLHLGFHKGGSVNILGYVQNKSDLFKWLDACLYVCE